jgi:hypothetical protein
MFKMPVPVAATGTGNRVMTSPDGVTWTLQTPAANNNWWSVAYNGVFVSVSDGGAGNRVMTSSRHTPAADAPVVTDVNLGTGNVTFTQSTPLLATSVSNYEYSTDGGTVWTAMSPADNSSPLTIAGLSSGTTQMRIRAISSAGTSCPSNNFESALPSAAGPSTGPQTGSIRPEGPAALPVGAVDMRVYPNPTRDGRVTVELTGAQGVGTGAIRVLDMSGRLVLLVGEPDWRNGRAVVEMPLRLTPGGYVLQWSDRGVVRSRRIELVR